MESRQELEIKLLKSQLSDLTELLSNYQNEYLGPQATVMATNKVIELSKRNRHLTADWESLRTKCNNYEKRCLELEAQLQATTVERLQEPTPEVAESDLVRVTEELKETKTKLFEALNTNTSLRNNLKLAHKFLEQEIGQPISLKSLAVDSKWRGRSQTILALQQKVADLEGKTSPVQVRSVSSLRKFDELEQCKKEVDNLRQLCDEQKFKLTALKSRNQILAAEAASLKQKCANQVEQGKNDRRMIEALNNKIDELSFEKEIKSIETKKVDENDECRKQLEEVRKEVETKEAKIDELNNRTVDLEENVKKLAGDFLFQCRDLKKEQFIAMLEAMEQQNIALTQKLADEVKKLDDERGKQKKQNELLARRKTRINQLESKIKELELLPKKEGSHRSSISSQVTPVGSKHKFPVPPNSRASNETLPNYVEIQDLKYKLEYSNEHIRILEQTSKELMAEKDSFCQYFCDVIARTREIFLNSFNEIKV